MTTTTTTRTTRNSLEYEHLAIALRKVAKADNENDDFENDVDGDVAVVRSRPSYSLSPANLSTLTPSRLRSLLRPHFLSPTTGEEDVAAMVRGRYYKLPNVEIGARFSMSSGGDCWTITMAARSGWYPRRTEAPAHSWG